MNEKTEKADFEKLENRASEKAENCIIRMTKKIKKLRKNEKNYNHLKIEIFNHNYYYYLPVEVSDQVIRC